MPRIQTSCPNCKQPLVAEIFQVVDIKQDPRLKDLLLAGRLNLAQCPVCGFQGQLPVPLVYHDGGKELLLTFTPPDANKTMQEKESALAPLLKQVTDRLTPEERKGYLFQPKAMLTMNNLVKNVLLADGITEEMIQAQQEKMALLEKLFSLEGEQLRQEVKDNQDKIDREFFAIFAEIAQQILASRDEKSIDRIKEVQDVLMEVTEIGRSIKSEAEEIRAATQAIEGLGSNLTRSSLLELILASPNQERVKAYAGLVRPAMDYEFFKLFTDRIEATDAGGERKEMVERRNLLLKITQEIDQQIEERLANAKQQIELILEEESVEEALLNKLASVDQFFVQAVSSELLAARDKQDKEREEKLTGLLQVIQRLTSPPELQIVEALLGAADDEDLVSNMINELDEEILPGLVDTLTSIISSYDDRIAAKEGEDLGPMKDTQEKLKSIFNVLLRRSMELKMKE